MKPTRTFVRAALRRAGDPRAAGPGTHSPARRRPRAAGEAAKAMSTCQLICPNLRCRKILKVPEEARGKVVRCQYCQSLLRVPTRAAGPQAPAAVGGKAPGAPGTERRVA